MRLLVIVLLFQILFLYGGFSQNNVEIMGTTNVWYVTQPITNKPDDYRVSMLYFEGDTTINNIQYKNLVLGSIDFPNIKARYCGCLRSDTVGDVMWVPAHQNQEYLLYPKNITINDSIGVYASFYGNDNRNIQTLVVIAEDSIYSVDRFLKCYSLQRSCGAKASQKWIKGIGSTNGLIRNSIEEHCIIAGIPIPMIAGAVSPILIAMKNANGLHYFNPKYLNLKENILNIKN